MESRIIGVLLKAAVAGWLAMVVTGCSSTMLADEAEADRVQPVIDPQVERREVSSPKIGSQDFELGAYIGYMSVEDFGSNTVYGARLAYHITEGFFAEATLGSTDAGKTSYENLSGSSAPLLSSSDREFRYYDLSIGYNLLPGEVFIGRNRAFNSALYVLLGAGNTRFAGDDYFTVTYGVGYRVLATNWLGLHFNIRDHMFDIDITGKDKTTHNIEFTLGATVFF